MTQPAKAQDPSMEEILASIRRIIADEEAAKPPPAAPEPAPGKAAIASASPPPPPPPASPEPAPRAPADSIERRAIEGRAEIESAPEVSQPEPAQFAEAMSAADAAEEAAFPDVDAHSNDDFEDAAASTAGESRGGGHLRAVELAAPLLSAEATAAVNSAFGTLAHTVLVQNARTLEDLVREMLRPMLKTWLDDNLPNLVERLVRAEIERVSRGHPG